MTRSRYNQDKISTAAMLMLGMLILSSIPTAYGAGNIHLGKETQKRSLHLVQSAERSENARLYEYHGLAYDMFSGNPKGETVDLGFQPKNVFELTYDKGFKTADGFFFSPDQVTVVTDMSCSFASTSTTYTGMSSYQTDLSAAVSLEGSYDGAIVSAAFSASAEYREMKSAVEEEEKVAVVTQAKCILYHSSLMESAKISEDFKQAISNAYKEKSFDKFVNAWGTHYAHEIEFGAQAIQRTFFSRKDVQEMQSMGVDVAVAVSGSGWGAEANLTAKVGYNQAQSSKFSNAKKEVRESYIGLAPPANGEARVWLANIKESNPVPTGFKLTPISALLTSRYFGETYAKTQLEEIRKLLEASIFLKSTKMDRVNPSDDKLGPATTKVVDTERVGQEFMLTSSYSMPKDKKHLLRIKKAEVTYNYNSKKIVGLQFTFTDGFNDFFSKKVQEEDPMLFDPTTSVSWSIPAGRSISHIQIFMYKDSSIAGIEFYLDNGIASPHFGYYGESEVRVDIKGQIVDIEYTYKRPLQTVESISGIKFAVHRTYYDIIRGFKQYKTDKAGKDVGVAFSDPDRPVLEIATKKVVLQAGDSIDGLQVVLSLGSLEFESEFRGGRGGWTKEFALDANEYFTTVSVWAGGSINAIEFTTNTGRVEKFGKSSGSASKVWTINGYITGFYGFQGRLINSLGIKYTSAL